MRAESSEAELSTLNNETMPDLDDEACEFEPGEISVQLSRAAEQRVGRVRRWEMWSESRSIELTGRG
jgi:hypothetical protein